jgi:hypothetical protein
VDLYSWLLDRHIVPHLGGAPGGKLSASMIREWQAALLGNGRRNLNRAAGWSYATAAIGPARLHLHDLRRAGNTFAVATRAGLTDLMARMGQTASVPP